jgi:hypothetical protein
LFFSCCGSVAALPALANFNERRGTTGNGPDITVKYLQRTTSGAAGNGLSTTAKYLRQTTSGAAGNGLGATIKYLRRTTSGAAVNGLGKTIKYLRPDIPFFLVRTLADTKTLACGKSYRSFCAENPYKRKNYPVEQRAALVPKQYFSKARSLDHQLHGTPRGTVGPIEAKLLEYGALDGPDAHAAAGLVLGAFGELSTSCYSFCTSIARVAAERLLSF